MKVLIRDIIREIREYVEKLPVDSRNIKPLVNMASELALLQLNKLLKQLEANDHQEATLITLQPLISLLSDHGEEGEGFLNTNAIITNSPQSNINRVYFKIASILSKLFNAHPYDYILPTLRDSADKNKIYQLKPHQFVLTEDNLSAIDVAKCLNEAAAKYRTTLYRTYGPELELTQSETERVISHSIQTLYYHESIQAFIRFKSDTFKNTMETAGGEFNAAIQSDAYEIRSHYGEEGDRILINYIAKHTVDLRQLSDLMVKYLPRRKQWEEFIAKMYTSDLNRITQSDDTLTSIFNQYSEEHLRAAAFCRDEYYKRDRKNNPSNHESYAVQTIQSTINGVYKNWVGGDGSSQAPLKSSEEKKETAKPSNSWFGMYSKSLIDYSKQLTKVAEEAAGKFSENLKLETVQTHQDFLLSNYALDQWMVYLKDKNKEHCYAPFRSGTLWLMVASEMEAIVSAIPKTKASPM